MKKLGFFFFFVVITNTLFAQYTPVINSKRPGASESPYGVGTDVLQVEAGIFAGSTDTDNEGVLTNPIGGHLFLRYGKFIEALEINTNIVYQKNDIYTSTNNSPESVSGLSRLDIGAKYFIYQREFVDKSKEIRSWKLRNAYDKNRLIPSVGVYAGVNLNFVEEAYKQEGMSYKAALLLQNDFTKRLNLITNILLDNISSEQQYFSYIFTVTYGFGNDWSIFGELQGKNYNDLGIKENIFGCGLAYLVSRDLQFDAAFRYNTNDLFTDMIGSVGVSWRLDNHKFEEAPTEEEQQEELRPEKVKNQPTN